MTFPRPGLAAGLVALLAMLFVVQPAHAQHCEREDFGGASFVICTIDPQADDLRLFWKDADDRPYRHFSNLADSLDQEGERLVFAINAGMYMPDFTPSGLYIENGEQLRALNTRQIDGPPAQVPNFFKRPNGVFFTTAEGAGVLTTEAFGERQPEALLATQSGPMLVIDGQFHPAFIQGSSDRTRRSGVGVCEEGLVRFAISDGRINFYDFATLFRDHLGCDNALFLDGGQGVGLYHPALRRHDRSWHGGFGPIFGVVE